MQTSPWKNADVNLNIRVLDFQFTATLGYKISGAIGAISIAASSLRWLGFLDAVFTKVKNAGPR